MYAPLRAHLAATSVVNHSRQVVLVFMHSSVNYAGQMQMSAHVTTNCDCATTLSLFCRPEYPAYHCCVHAQHSLAREFFNEACWLTQHGCWLLVNVPGQMQSDCEHGV